MTPIIEDSVLATPLDCQNFDILNAGQLYPVPLGLVGTNDPALDGPRVPVPGSVTDLSVNAIAAIAQDKLLFNGAPPPSWIGGNSKQFAPSELVERVANKGAPNGYAALGADGKLPPSQVAAGTDIGTVTYVGLKMPPEMQVAGSPITDSGSFATTWKDAPDGSWFGVMTAGLGGILQPAFQVAPLPPGAIPSIDATKFTSGVFDKKHLPVASGGADHAPGAVPDPGLIGLPTDYLGRDMQWHTLTPDVITQPRCPMPTITLDSWTDKDVTVTIRSKLPGSSLFILVQKYPLYESPGFSLSKVEHHDKDFPDIHDTLTVHELDIVWAYAAKAGYNNSGFATQCPGAGKTNPWLVVTPLTVIPYPDVCP